MRTAKILPFKPKNKMSRKMRAIQNIFQADKKLSEAVSLFVDANADCVFWEMIYRLPLNCEQTVAVDFAHSIWDSERFTLSCIFEDGLDMNPDLQKAVLDAIAIRWGLGK